MMRRLGDGSEATRHLCNLGGGVQGRTVHAVVQSGLLVPVDRTGRVGFQWEYPAGQREQEGGNRPTGDLH